MLNANILPLQLPQGFIHSSSYTNPEIYFSFKISVGFSENFYLVPPLTELKKLSEYVFLVHWTQLYKKFYHVLKSSWSLLGMDVSFSGILSFLEEKADKLISSGQYTKVDYTSPQDSTPR